MEKLSYQDFDVLIEKAEQGFSVRVLSSPAGEASTRFQLPFSEMELDNVALQLGRTRRGVRRLESPEMEIARTFGKRLFEGVFTGEVRDRFRSSLSVVDRQGGGLRIRLRLSGAPELANIPWEYLYDASQERFLVLSNRTPLVRYLEISQPARPLALKPPLNVILMISSPSDYPPLDVEREWTKLKQALGELEQKGLVSLTRLEEATLDALRRKIRTGEFHIFHFIGHGGFDQQAQDGVLVMEDENQRSRNVSGRYLGTILHDHRPLRLAILNACEGARTSRNDPFAGAAQSLVQQGIPSVIAMQFEITDEAAITFAHEFYGAVAEGFPVDAALAEARKAIFSQDNDVEWGTPVLYLCSPDGFIFDIATIETTRTTTIEAIKPTDTMDGRLERLYTDGLSAFWLGEWEKACDYFQTILVLRPNQKDAASKLEEARRQLKHQTLYNQAYSAEEAKDWLGALSPLEELVRLDPMYKDASARLEAIHRKKSLADLYDQALTLYQAGKWLAVVNVFTQINAIDPAYPDPHNLLANARSQAEAQKSQAELDSLYGQAVREIDARQWVTARQLLTRVQEQKPAYRETEKLLRLVAAEIEGVETVRKREETAKPGQEAEEKKPQEAVMPPARQVSEAAAPVPSMIKPLLLITGGWLITSLILQLLNLGIISDEQRTVLAIFSLTGLLMGCVLWAGFRVSLVRLDWISSAGLILGWSVGFAVFIFIGMFYDTTEDWLLVSALGGAIGGLITGLVLQRSTPGLQKKHVGLITLGWSASFLIGEVVYILFVSSNILLATTLNLGIAGLIGGWVTLTQLSRRQIQVISAAEPLTSQTTKGAPPMPLEKGLIRRITWKTIVPGMIGFTVGMIVTYLLAGLASDTSALILISFPWGAIGGASLAIPTKSIKKILLLGVLGGAGTFFGSLLWMFLNLSEPISKIEYAFFSSWDIAPLLYLLTGLSLGASLGIYTRKAKSMLVLSIAGGAIFTLVYFLLTILNPTSSVDQIRSGSIIVAGVLIGGVMDFTWSYVENAHFTLDRPPGNSLG